MVQAVVHEFGNALVFEVVDHLDFDLLQDLSPLFLALSRHRAVEALLGGRHVDHLDGVLVGGLSHHDAVDVGGEAAAEGVLLREGGDAFQDDVDELDVEGGGEDLTERLILSLQLVNALRIVQLWLVNLAKELVDQLEEKHAEQGLIQPDEGQ